MKNFYLETEEDFEKLKNEYRDKIYNKFFKNTENIEDSILCAIKKQMLNLTHIYIYIAEIRHLLKELQKTNPNKIIDFYNEYLLNIYVGIDIAMANFCNMTAKMSKINNRK